MQQGFSQRIPAFRIAAHQQGADGLGAVTAAGLAGCDDVDAALPQGLAQLFDLGGFAGPFAALEGDEAACCHGVAAPKIK